MSQHFLQSSAARSLNLLQVMRMDEEEAEAAFRLVRWSSTEGKPTCPKCGSLTCYDCRRPNGAPRFRCKDCGADFSITSGTLFASHKLPLRTYLAAIAIFCNEVKGKSSLAMSRDLGTSHKAAWVLCHKLREAMASEVKAYKVGGNGKIASVDGGYFGGYVKPANFREHRVDRRRAINKSGKRQVVVVVREHQGHAVPAVFRSELDSMGFVKSKVERGTILNADEANSWNELQGRFEMRRINHQEAYSFDGACTNEAESFFSRMRRAEIGHHHHVAGAYLARYAQEAAWREDRRRQANGKQVEAVSGLAMKLRPSVDFSGYWQRHIEARPVA